MKYVLPKLPYKFDALEPYIDAMTMEIHYTKHHQGYTDNLNAAVSKYPELAETEAGQLLKDINKLNVDEKDRTAIRNNGGGYVNHSFFWNIMAPEKQIDQTLADNIVNKFGSLDKFKEEFEKSALTRFGSGWAWLVKNKHDDLEIYSTPNQDSPLSKGDKPLIAIDVWEHAYYLKYQNRRAEYIKNWWNVLKLLP